MSLKFSKNREVSFGMKSKWYKNNVLYIFLASVVLVFNFVMIFFAAGYMDMMWNISNATSNILSFVFVGLLALNGVMLFRNYRQ